MAARPRFHRVAGWAVAAVVLVCNPLFGLGAEEPHFGAKELRAAVEGTRRLTLRTVDGAEQTIAFTIVQGGPAAGTHASNRALVQPAAACGTRTLVKPAGACVDETYMPLEVTLLVPWARQRQEPGQLMVEAHDSSTDTSPSASPACGSVQPFCRRAACIRCGATATPTRAVVDAGADLALSQLAGTSITGTAAWAAMSASGSRRRRRPAAR
jgi:hypothetical protein